MTADERPTLAPPRGMVRASRDWAGSVAARRVARLARGKGRATPRGNGTALDPPPASKPGDPDYDLLTRFRSYFVGGVLGFRALFAVPPLAILLAYNGPALLAPLLPVWVLLVALDLAVIPFALRHDALAGRMVRWLVADVVVGVVVNVASVPFVPGSINEPYHDLFWFWFMGSAVLWTAWSGARGGICVVLVTVPVQLVMTALSEPQPAHEVAPMIIGRTVWLLAGVLVGVLILAVTRLSARGALSLGLQVGRQSEQIRVLRDIHDTALQTLEAIGLTAEDERISERQRLRRVVEAANTQAAGIRVALTAADGGTEPEDPEPGLLEVIREAAATQGAAGTTVRWQSRRLRGVRVPRRSAEALRSGLREALTNVHRHAAARSATVRLSALPDRLEVVVLDDGRGFDERRPGGFGIRHSIVGRLEDAGGGAVVRSGPGGTTVTMWVPR